MTTAPPPKAACRARSTSSSPSTASSQLETAEFLKERIDKLGGPELYNHYAVGWAHAMCTPYQWTKQVASHFGGTRNGTIVHWPNGIKANGETRAQFHHVIDVAPTLLEAARRSRSRRWCNGVTQAPIEGVSMIYPFDDAKAESTRTTQYFEMGGNRGIYHHGWTAVTKHRTPWELGNPKNTLDEDVWELYDTTKDWTQARDPAKANPQKLSDLQRLWLIEVPRGTTCCRLTIAGREVQSGSRGPADAHQGQHPKVVPGHGLLNENCVLNVKNKSYSVTAEVVIPKGGANGVIVNQGGITGGWSLYVKDGKAKYCYNFVGLSTCTLSRHRRFTKGRINCGWSSRTTAAASVRAARSHC